MSDIIYFDNSATTSVYPDVLSEMNEVYLKYYGNPSSLHKMGMKQIYSCRNQGNNSKTLNVPDNCIYFTSGGTSQTTGL